jgi:hypothetical protein
MRGQGNTKILTGHASRIKSNLNKGATPTAGAYQGNAAGCQITVDVPLSHRML